METLRTYTKEETARIKNLCKKLRLLDDCPKGFELPEADLKEQNEIETKLIGLEVINLEYCFNTLINAPGLDKWVNNLYNY